MDLFLMHNRIRNSQKSVQNKEKKKKKQQRNDGKEDLTNRNWKLSIGKRMNKGDKII